MVAETEGPEGDSHGEAQGKSTEKVPEAEETGSL